MRYLIRNTSLLLLTFLLAVACSVTEDGPNQYSDDVLVRIADFQDRRLADSLYPFFSHDNALYRREAAKAFGSLQLPAAVEKLGGLLGDSDGTVRAAAAFAVGQTGEAAAKEQILQALGKETDSAAVRELLEAYGKITDDWDLDAEPYLKDSARASALAWSLYRAGLRGKVSGRHNELAIRLIGNENAEATRLAAAHFFARGAKDFDSVAGELVNAALKDPSPDVRMAAASALGKIRAEAALTALKTIVKEESDHRVITNAIKGMASFPYAQVKHYLYEALNHKEISVGVAAAESILAMIPADDWIEVSSLVNTVKHWRIRATIYQAALKAGQNKNLASEIRQEYEKATEPYQRAAYLASLSHYPEASTFVSNALKESDTAIIRSAAAATLVAMNRSSSFRESLRSDFAGMYRELISRQSDPAVIGILAAAVADKELGYDKIFRDTSFLHDAKSKLSLPEHNETLQSVEAAIALIGKKRAPATVANHYNHPINWQLVARIPAKQLATIRTTRGNIVIRLLVNEAPGSVANFVELAQADYFDNKFFHRVVPNFVIQSGCKRGDGWGSEDYSIRSEFSQRRYTTGSVGMASAGKDTEGTQWFISHSPTPHLDGRYTIFAEVEEGLAVVDYIQMGDRILDVEVELPTATDH